MNCNCRRSRVICGPVILACLLSWITTTFVETTPALGMNPQANPDQLPANDGAAPDGGPENNDAMTIRRHALQYITAEKARDGLALVFLLTGLPQDSIVVQPRLNGIVIKGKPKDVELISAMLDRLDVQSPLAKKPDAGGKVRLEELVLRKAILSASLREVEDEIATLQAGQ